MEPWPPEAIATVAAAVIAAGAALVVAYIQYRRHAEVDAKLEQLEAGRNELAGTRKTLETRAAGLAELEAKLNRLRSSIEGGPAPYQIKTWRTVLRLDADGCGEMTRECDGIVAPQSVDALRIPFKAWVQQGALEERQPRIEPLATSVVDPEWQLQRDTGAVVEGWIWFRDLRTHAGETLGFRAVQRMGRAFCASKEELDEAYRDADFKREYFASTAIVPVEVLEIVVEFPTNFDDLHKRASPAVFYGSSEELFWGEVERLKEEKAFTYSGKTATVRVSKPIRGHQYAIAWVPPHKAAAGSAKP